MWQDQAEQWFWTHCWTPSVGGSWCSEHAVNRSITLHYRNVVTDMCCSCIFHLLSVVTCEKAVGTQTEESAEAPQWERSARSPWVSFIAFTGVFEGIRWKQLLTPASQHHDDRTLESVLNLTSSWEWGIRGFIMLCLLAFCMSLLASWLLFALWNLHFTCLLGHYLNSVM